MKHDIHAYWIPSTASNVTTTVGNQITVGGVVVENYQIADLIKVYSDNGVGHAFMCCEIKPEETTREQYSRDVFGVHDVMYIQSDRDLAFKEDDTIMIPTLEGGTYRIIATDNSRVKPIKNGFRTTPICINITMVKQD